MSDLIGETDSHSEQVCKLHWFELCALIAIMYMYTLQDTDDEYLQKHRMSESDHDNMSGDVLANSSPQSFSSAAN